MNIQRIRVRLGESVGSLRFVHQTVLAWIDCRDCKQSATGSYAGVLGCTRCGWYEGKP